MIYWVATIKPAIVSGSTRRLLQLIAGVCDSRGDLEVLAVLHKETKRVLLLVSFYARISRHGPGTQDFVCWENENKESAT